MGRPRPHHRRWLMSDEKVSLREHLETKLAAAELLRAADDRRYTEVGIEREKALKIKETADLAALGLAREIQTYKDEKANELREQISSERGLYVTKTDLAGVVKEFQATVKPIADYVSSQQGKGVGLSQVGTVVLGAVAVASLLLAVFLAVAR